MYTRTRTLAGVVLLSLVLIACGGGGSSSSGGGSGKIAGRWQGSFIIPGRTCGSSFPLTVRMNLALSQSGSSLKGTYRARFGCPGIPDQAGPVSGSVNGSKVTLIDDDGSRYDLEYGSPPPNMLGTFRFDAKTVRLRFLRPR